MKSVKLPSKILVGTHHKTGTSWFLNIFRSIAKTYSLDFFYGKQASLPFQFDIFFEDHSNFDCSSLEPPYRGLHLIRDPRDVIVSGCFYHQRAKENWLLTSESTFGGRSYQDTLNSFSNFNDKILFEMEHASKYTINDLLNWNYTNEEFYEVKYEELIFDKELKKFAAIFKFLQFPKSEEETLKSIAYNNSLFSGKVCVNSHVRSGLPGQWKKYFTSIHRRRFVELFGEGLIMLGYEENNSWAE